MQIAAVVMLFFVLIGMGYSSVILWKQLGWKSIKRQLGYMPIVLIFVTVFMIVTDLIPAHLQDLRNRGLYSNYGMIAFLSSLQKFILPLVGLALYRNSIKNAFKAIFRVLRHSSDGE